MNIFRTILNTLRPIYLLFATLTYFLGAGMARYLGAALDWTIFWPCLFWILLFLAAIYILDEYFRLPFEPLDEDQTLRQREQHRALLFQVALACLAVVAALTVWIFYSRVLTLTSGIFLGLNVVLFVAYAIPPFRLSNSGYGELANSVLLANFIPALAFVLQTSIVHRLLAIITFPLTLLALAYFLTTNLRSFARDRKLARRTLLMRLTWQRAVRIHHVLILLAYLLYGLSTFVGLPWGIYWPTLLTLPLALLQVFWVQRIVLGGRPIWNFLISLSTAVFGLTAYLLALTFWIR